MIKLIMEFRLISRLSASLIITGALIGSSFILQANHSAWIEEYSFLGVLGFGVAIISLVVFLISSLRPGCQETVPLTPPGLLKALILRFFEVQIQITKRINLDGMGETLHQFFAYIMQRRFGFTFWKQVVGALGN